MEYPADIFKQLTFFTEPGFKQELLQHAKLVTFNKGDVIVKDGQYVRFLPIVLKGAIRVYQQKEDREVLLYYVRANETCTMSLAAAYFNNKSTSHGIVTEPTNVLIFPANMIDQWQLKYASWNRYVLNMFRSRYDEMITAMESIAFDPIHVRAWRYLKAMAVSGRGNVIHLSHQQLAAELGTTRVVISRILKEYEHQGKIKLYRGKIEIFDRVG
jgi:CRP/FNR family transcriptional regulator